MAQSELEDLCFAVLQPDVYRRLRIDLDILWGLPSSLAPQSADSPLCSELPALPQPLLPESVAVASAHLVADAQSQRASIPEAGAKHAAPDATGIAEELEQTCIESTPLAAMHSAASRDLGAGVDSQTTVTDAKGQHVAGQRPTGTEPFADHQSNANMPTAIASNHTAPIRQWYEQSAAAEMDVDEARRISGTSGAQALLQ